MGGEGFVVGCEVEAAPVDLEAKFQCLLINQTGHILLVQTRKA